MLLFIISFLASVNDSIGYNYLMEYDPGIVSYHNLSVSGNGDYRFEELVAPRGGSSLGIGYYKRNYSLKNDWYLRMAPGGRFYRISEENRLDASLKSEGDYKIYPVTIPVFLSSGGYFYGLWREGLDGEDSDYYGIEGELKTGIGFGRMIPLSTAYQALKIEEELIELGKLDENISKEELKQITDFLRNSSRYLDAREFWRDFEDIIKNLKGFNSDRLGAVPTIRINEIINGSVFAYAVKGREETLIRSAFPYSVNRDRGFEIKGYAGFDFVKRSAIDFDESNENFFLGGNFTYSRPLSTKLQFLFDSEVETYVSDSVRIKSIDISSSFYYEVLKKLYMTLDCKYNKDINRYNGREEEYLLVSLSPTYYIQYRMSFSLRGTYYYYIEYPSIDSRYRGFLSASFRYYIF